MAGVSTPTISRFESGETDIQLPTVLSILGVLGMTDQRTLTFPEPMAHYSSSKEGVAFTGVDASKIIPCAISREALEDHFNGENKDPLKLYKSNRERIEHLVRRKYLAELKESDGSVLVRTGDI